MTIDDGILSIFNGQLEFQLAFFICKKISKLLRTFQVVYFYVEIIHK
jgi:hypothetical protein